MDFSLVKNINNYYDLVFKSGDVISSNIDYFEFYGDNYYLVKNKYSNCFKLLNERGELLFDEKTIIKRFSDGRLLTLERKVWESSRNDQLDTSYIFYKIFNYENNSIVELHSFMEYSGCKNLSTDYLNLNVYHIGKCYYIDLYIVDGFIFSEIFDSKFIIFAYSTSRYIYDSKVFSGINIKFEEIINEEIWSVMDLNNPDGKISGNQNLKSIVNTILILHSDPEEHRKQNIFNLNVPNTKVEFEKLLINKLWATGKVKVSKKLR